MFHGHLDANFFKLLRLEGTITPVFKNIWQKSFLCHVTHTYLDQFSQKIAPLMPTVPRGLKRWGVIFLKMWRTSLIWEEKIFEGFYSSENIYKGSLWYHMEGFAQFGLNRFKQGQKCFSQLQLSLDAGKLGSCHFVCNSITARRGFAKVICRACDHYT